MSLKSEIAIEKFYTGYNCAQSALYPFIQETGLDENAALKLACGFGGGMGQLQEVCGALSGGILAISSKYGKGVEEDPDAKNITYSKVKALGEAFREEFGSLKCKELLNCDTTTQNGKDYYKKYELKEMVCKNCVEKVVKMVEEVI